MSEEDRSRDGKDEPVQLEAHTQLPDGTVPKSVGLG
jgi:hypothetical protein